MKSKTSRLGNPAAPQDDPDDPLVCYCMKIPRSSLLECIAAGAQNLEQVMQSTTAGTGCGTCRVDLIAMLRDAGKRSDG